MTANPLSHIHQLLLALLVAVSTSGGARAAPEDHLVGALRGGISRPQLRCEWVAGHFERADRTLSLYREELASLFLVLDGARIADSTRGGVLRIEFETRLFGPPTARVLLDAARAPAAAKIAAGGILEVGFTDRRRGAHPLFCGVVAAVNRADTGQAEIVALAPRAGQEQRRSARYTDLTVIDALQSVAADAGLTLEVQDTRSHPVRPLILRRSVADWPFLWSLARESGMDLVLRPDHGLLASVSAFVPPPPPMPRTWTDMTWVEIAGQLAAESGRVLDAQLTGSYPPVSLRQTLRNDDFLVDLAVAQQISAWWAGDRLRLREDAVWVPDPAAQDAPVTKLTLRQLATTIAERHGLRLRAGPLPAVPVAVARREETDAELLLRVLGTHGVHIETRGSFLHLRTARTPGDVTDLLTERIVIAGSKAAARRFERRHSDPREQLLAPENIATTAVLLDLGTALAPSTSPPRPLADAGRIAVEFEAALGRLAARPPSTSQSRFLQDFARTYRPTLIQLHRLRPGGADVLRAIAPPP